MIQRVNNYKKLTFCITILFIVGLVATVYWASLKDSEQFGIGQLAVDSRGRFWIPFNDRLYILDDDGKIIRQFTAEQLEIQPPFAGIAALPDGGMLIGSIESGKIHLINADGSKGQVINPQNSGTQKLFRSFHLYYYPQRDAILLTDTSNHRIIMLGRDGKVLAEKGVAENRPGVFHFPNGIVADASGRIIVADTNNHEIKVLDHSLNIVDTWNPLYSARYSNSPYSFKWPVYLAVDDLGNIYVTNHDNNLESAEIAILNQRGERKSLIPLLNREQPVSVIVKKEALFVTDNLNFQILKLDLRKNLFSRFGGSEFLNILNTDKEYHSKLKQIILVGQVLLVFILLGLITTLIAIRRIDYKRPMMITIQVPSETEKVSFLRRVELALLTMSIAIFRLTIMILALTMLISVANLVLVPYFTWLIGWISFLTLFLPIFVIFFLFSMAGRFLLARGAVNGRYNPVYRFYAKRLMCRHAKIIEKLITDKKTIKYYSMAIVGGYPALLLLTENKFFIISLNRFGNIIKRMQGVYCASIHSSLTIERKLLIRRNLFPENPIVHFIFNISRNGTAYNLDFIDHTAAREIWNKILSCNIVEGESQSGWQEYCTTCGNILTGPAGCQIHGTIKSSVWKPVALSIFFPGMGQLYNQELLKGITNIVCFGGVIIYLMNPIIALVLRTKEVGLVGFWQLITIAIILWLQSIFDSWFVARRDRIKKWGLG